jgi:hypothetical protein
MAGKFQIGQRVKVVSRGRPGSDDLGVIAPFVGQTGTILESSAAAIGASKYYFYKIRIDNRRDEISVPEDALESVG